MNDNYELAREQEYNLIGALLKDPAKIEAVAEIVKPEDFANHSLAAAYAAMLNLRERGMGVDSVTLGDELERHGKLEDFAVGSFNGRWALADLRSNFRGELPETYAVKILDYSAKRQALELFSLGATWASNERTSDDLIADIVKRLAEVRVPNAKANLHNQTFKEALSQNYDEVSNGNVSFVPTGFYDLDRAFDNGLYAPDFMIVAGRPGTGKTALMLSVAMNAAKKGKRVVMFSLEMSNGQIVMRAASMETGIAFGAMRSRKMSAEQKTKYNEFIEEFEDLPLHLNDLPAITINTMRTTLRGIESVHGKIDLVVVDYLQLQGADGRHDNRQGEVSEVSRGLKAIAKDFNVPVLAGAQLSRAIENRAEKRPVLSDLRESGSLEQDADIVAFIYTSDEYKDTGQTDLIVAKHRNGKVGTITLKFIKEQTKFENATSRMVNVR